MSPYINIKQQFIEYFTRRNFYHFEDDSIIPQIDSEGESLFIGAGVYKFKHFFEKKQLSDRDYCSVQPCVRLDDIDLVGDTTHLTSFLMGGIFGFGFHSQYEILHGVFDFILNTIPQCTTDNFYITVHPDISYIADIWKSIYPSIEIIFLEDNIWKAPGISGYSTEIMYKKSADDIIEVGNIVLVDMGNKEIFYDVGVGIDRIDSIVNQLPIGANKKYFANIFHNTSLHNADQSHLVILNDFLHTIHLIVKEGIKTGPKKREYILRNLIRRSLNLMYKLNLSPDFLDEAEKILFIEEKNKINLILNKAKIYLNNNLSPDYDYLSSTIGCTRDMFDTYLKYNDSYEQ